MAYAVLECEIVGKWGSLEQTLSRADAAARKFASSPRSVKFKVDERVFAQIDNVRRMLRTIGTTNVVIDLIVNGEAVAVSKMEKPKQAIDAVGNALDRTNAKAQLVSKNLKELGSGGTVKARFDSRDVAAGPNIDVLRAQAISYQKQFAAGTSNKSILKTVNSLASEYEGKGIDASMIREAIPQLREMLAIQKDIKANRTVKLEVGVDPEGRAMLKDISLELKGTQMTAEQTASAMRRLDGIKRSLRVSGVGAGTVLGQDPSLDAASLDRYAAAARKVISENRALQKSQEAAAASAKAQREQLAALKVTAKEISASTGSTLPALSGLKSDQITKLNAWIEKTMELVHATNQLSGKGFVALANSINASAATTEQKLDRVKAKLSEIANVKPGESRRADPNTAAYEKALAENKLLAIQVKELDGLMLKIEASGGKAMLPLIMSCRTAEEAIALATNHLTHLQQAAAKGISMPIVGNASDRMRSLNMAGLTDEDDLARKARRVADAAANSTRKSAATVAEIAQIRASMSQLESVIGQVRQAGGTALLPFIQSADSLAISLDRAKIALKDMTALNRIGAGAMATDIKPGSGAAIASDFEKVNRVVQNTRNSLKVATDAIAAFETRVNAMGVNGALPGNELGKGMRKAAQDIREADKSSKSLGETVSGLLNTIRRWIIGYVAVSQLIKAFGALKYAILDFNSLLEKARITLTTLFDGSVIQADALMRKLKTFARITPFEFKDLVPLTQRLLSLGVVAKDTADKKLIPTFRAIGDTVASLGGSPEVMDRIVYAFGNMVQKGKASAEEVTRQLGNANVPALKYMAQAAGVSTAEMMKRMKAGAVDGSKAVQAILYGMANDPKFKGNMEKLSQTFEGAFNNIKDTATEMVSGAFKSVFDFLSRQMQSIVKIIQTTKFQLDWKDRVDGVKEAFLALYNTVKALYELIVKFKGTLVLLFVVLGTLGQTNPFVLILLGIARAIIGIQQLLENWDQMSFAVKAATVALTLFGIALASVQIGLWIKNLELATLATVTFGRVSGFTAISSSAAWIKFSGDVAFLGRGAAFSNLIAGISSLSLVILPLLVAAGLIAAAMWQEYQAHAGRADNANNNLAISLDATGEAFKKVENAFAGVNSQFAKNSMQKMADDFEKAKDSVGKLDSFLRKHDSKFIEDVIVQSKLDPVDAGEVRDQFKKYTDEAARVRDALKFKVEIDNEPTGWAALVQNFKDVRDQGGNIITMWANLTDAVSNFVHSAQQLIADLLHTTLGGFGDKITGFYNQAVDYINLISGISPVQLSPLTVGGTPAAVPAPAKTGAASLGVPVFGPPVATAEDKARQKLITDAGKYYSAVEEINKMDAKSLDAIQKRWSAGITKGDGFFRTDSYKTLRAALKERQALLGDAIQKPTNLDIDGKDGGESKESKAAKKAAAAAKKLENDRLQDAVKLNEARAAAAKATYEAMGKASEDSAKRQIDALKGVRDKMQSLLGTMQDVLSKYGVLNSPLDGIISKIEKLTQLGPKMMQAATKGMADMQNATNEGNAKQSAYQKDALHASMSLDKNNGGDGREPARAFKLDQKIAGLGTAASSGTLPSYVDAMMGKVGGTIGKQCGYTISEFLSRTGFDGNATSVARSGNARPNAHGTYNPGTIFNFQGRDRGKRDSRYRTNHYAMVAPDGQHWLESNWHGKGQRANMITDNRKIDWNRDIYAATWGGRVNAGVPRGVKTGQGAPGAVYGGNNQAASQFGRAGGVGRAAALNIGDGQNLMDSVAAELGNLKLGKFTALPKEFGSAIKDAEGHASRFAAQMFLADRATQEMLKATLGESGFKKLAGMIGEAADMTDRLENNLRARSETNELTKKQAQRGMEDNPLAQLQYRRRKGGDLEFLGNSKEDTARLIAARARLKKAEPAPAKDAGGLVFGVAVGVVTGQTAATKRLRAEVARLEAQYKSGNRAAADYLKAIRNDVLGEATDKLQAYISSEKDHARVLAESSKYMTDATVDTYAMARAQDLLGKKIEYRNSSEMKKLFNTDKKKYNENLGQFSRESENAYDKEADNKRAISMANVRQELDRSKLSLTAQIPLIEQYGGTQALLNIELQKQGDYFKELYRLRAEGAGDDESRRLAAEIIRRQEANRVIERQIALIREVAAAEKDAKDAAQDVATAKDLYKQAPYGSEALEQLQKYEAALKPLRARAGAGEFDAVGGGTQYAKLAEAAKSKVDSEIEGEKLANKMASIEEARRGSISAQNDLHQKQLELVGRVSDSQKYSLDLDAEFLARQGTTNPLLMEELSYRERILGTLRQQEIVQKAMDAKQHADSIRDMKDQIDSLGYSSKDASGVNQQDVFLEQSKIRRMQEEVDKMGSSQVDAFLTGDFSAFDALQTKIDDTTTAIKQAQETLDMKTMVDKATSAADAMKEAFDAVSSSITDGFHVAYSTSGSLFDRIEAGIGAMVSGIAGYFLQLAEKILATYITLQIFDAIMPGFADFIIQTSSMASSTPSLGSFTKKGGGGGSGGGELPPPSDYASSNMTASDPSARYSTASAARTSGTGGNTVNQTFTFPGVTNGEDARAVSGEIAGHTNDAFDSNRTNAQNASDFVSVGSRNR